MPRLESKVQILDYDLTPFVVKAYQGLLTYPPFAGKTFGPSCVSVIKKPAQVVSQQLDPRCMMLDVPINPAIQNNLTALLDAVMEEHWRRNLESSRIMIETVSGDGRMRGVSLYGERLMYGFTAQDWAPPFPAFFICCIGLALIKDATVRPVAVDKMRKLLGEQQNPLREHLVPMLNHARSLP